VIVEVRIRHRNPVTPVGDVKEAVVVIFVVRHVRGQVAVVDPHVLTVFHSDAVALDDLGALDVADNDVGLLLDAHTHTSDG